MDWCKGGNKHDETAKTNATFLRHRPKRRKTRCPVCNRYLMQQIRPCMDETPTKKCWHIKIPPHKAKR
jgi:uncharacterized protein with PIN domain